MQALQDRSASHGRRWSLWLLVAVALLGVGGLTAYVASRRTAASLTCVSRSCTAGTGSHDAGAAASNAGAPGALRVTSTAPASGATGVPPSTQVTVTFNAALKTSGPMPTLSPPVAGSWRATGRDRLVFTPSEPFLPFTKYTLSIPGGPRGVQSTTGAWMRASRTVTFTIANGSVLRLDQLLAQLGYLPVSFNGATPIGRDLATPQPGTFSWRWAGLPAALTSQWVAGSTDAITKGAVMMFETENSLTVDGIAGPEVWTALLHDVESNRINTEPISYVLVTKSMNPVEHLTAWVNGTLELHDVPVNTGVRGATTHNGTYQVFEHVRTSHMSGTDVTGTHYTVPTVPWVSYFNGGDALHYYPRAAYGFPQSNGCVEMQLATAESLWPNTPIGTLVTVQGPTYGVTSSKNTTPSPAAVANS